VDASAPDNVWAVGSRTTSENFADQSLVERWDGQAWTIVNCPDVGMLRHVAVVSPDDVWMTASQTLLHWNGQTCQEVPIPNGAQEIPLSDIATTGPDDVWVVGEQTGRMYEKNTVGWNTMVAHYDGTSWSVMATPNRAIEVDYLEGVVAQSPTDVWAAGYSQDVHGIPLTLLLHYDGKSWRIVPSPNPGDDYNVLWGIGTDGAGGVWGIGHYGDHGGHTTALFLRWTGTAWERVDPTPDPHWSVTGLSGSSAQDVWAVGSEPTGSFAVAHFDDTRWSSVDAPGSSGPYENWLYDVVTLSASDAWAVGVQNFGPDPHAVLIEHWDGSSWSVVPAPRR